MRRRWTVKYARLVLGVGLLVLGARPAAAQGFVSPFIGYNFGGDSGAGCQELTDCEDKKLNIGVAFGAFGPVFGFEEELAYARDFFGSGPGFDSSVLTLMSNLMVAPKIGAVRPYALAGIGLIKQKISLTAGDVFDSTNNDVGWDFGGGLMIFVGDHVGVRGDLRYFRTFKDVEIFGITLDNEKLDYGRASGAVVFSF